MNGLSNDILMSQNLLFFQFFDECLKFFFCLKGYLLCISLYRCVTYVVYTYIASRKVVCLYVHVQNFAVGRLAAPVEWALDEALLLTLMNINRYGFVKRKKSLIATHAPIWWIRCGSSTIVQTKCRWGC